MVKAVDLILTPAWILPVRPAGEVLENHVLVIHQGLIHDICTTMEAAERYEAAESIQLENKVLMPGLINAHGHAAMTLFRGLSDDLPLMDWLNNHIWPAESKWVSESFVASGTRLAIAEMLSGGITTFSDMYFFPEITAQVASESGIRCQTAFPILDFPSAWAANADEYIRKGLALIDEYRHSELITVAFGPHAPYTVSDEPLRRVVTLANQTDCFVQIHLHETAFEVEDAKKRLGQRPIARLENLGLLSPQTQCVHMTQLDEEDIRSLERTGAHVIHCPQSNLKLASGFCPVQRLTSRGINVAIGTDGAASNNTLDMWDEMRIAALLGKAVCGDASAIPAFKAIEMATINGARALGLEAVTGSLEIGKHADCIAVSLSEINAHPLYHLDSQLVYATKSTQVKDVWIQGRRHVADGNLLRLKTAQLIKEAGSWREKIQQG